MAGIWRTRKASARKRPPIIDEEVHRIIDEAYKRLDGSSVNTKMSSTAAQNS